MQVIAHRGASGDRPEHTLAAYELAVRQGADAVEPDLVVTRDGVLVARHEPDLAATTDIERHPELAGRQAQDLALAEVRRLRARERRPELRPGAATHDGRHGIPTFEEVLALAARLARELARPVGVRAELKHPTRSAALGLDPARPLRRALDRHPEVHRRGGVVLQSFDAPYLRALADRVDVPLVQLADAGGAYDALLRPAGLRGLAAYATGIAVAKGCILPRDALGRRLPPTALVDVAHACGLHVDVWTFRAENAFLPRELRGRGGPAGHGDLAGELRRFTALGVDGVITDHPAAAVAARAPAQLPY